MARPITVYVSIRKVGGRLKVATETNSVTAYRALGDEVQWVRLGDAEAYRIKLKPEDPRTWPFPRRSLRDVGNGHLDSGRIRADRDNGRHKYTIHLKKKKGSKLPDVEPLDPDIVIDDDPRGFIVDGFREFADRMDRVEALLAETVVHLKSLSTAKDDD